MLTPVLDILRNIGFLVWRGARTGMVWALGEGLGATLRATCGQAATHMGLAVWRATIDYSRFFVEPFERTESCEVAVHTLDTIHCS